MIAVVIPYFQREPGILRKALESVFASEGISDVCIVLVDDESPVPASKELAQIGNTRFPVRLIQQCNAGPGGARNTGLDNLPEEVDYVAFLDSDDTWAPQHLQRAILALEAGFDVYFSDHVQLGAEDSAFRRAGRIDLTKHRMIGGQPEIHAYEGDMFDQIITGNIIGTSTVVFDRRKFDGLRFRTDLTSAGEDYLFWLDLAHRGARFAFGVIPSVFYGKGVNVYAGAGWGTDGHSGRVLHELTYRKALISLYTLDQFQSQVIDSAIKSLRDAFISDCIHRAFHRKSINWKLVSVALRLDPKIVTRIPMVFMNMLFGPN